MARWTPVVRISRSRRSLSIPVPPLRSPDKSFCRRFIHRHPEEGHREAMRLGTNSNALEAHHAIVLHDVPAGHVIGDLPDARITRARAVAAAGALPALLRKP